MPHSMTSSRKKTLLNAQTKFYNDLYKLLQNDQKKIRGFNTMVQKLKSADPETVTAKINAYMKKFPELCNRIVGFHPDGSIKLRETEEEESPPLLQRLLIPDTPPARFTNDILLLVTPLLPFPSLGRLAQTCRWMSAHITEEQVKRALERAKERFGKVELVEEEEVTSTGVVAGYRQPPVLRLFNTNEEMIEVRRLTEQSPVYILKTQEKGRVYIGVSQKKPFADDDDGSIEAISDVIQHVKKTLQKEAKKKGHQHHHPTAWFLFKETFHGIRFGNPQHALSVSFMVIRDDDDSHAAAHCEVFFEELLL